MTPELDRVRAALSRCDAAAKHEGIEPDSYLGCWVSTNRELVEALYALEASREAQLRGVVAQARALAETSERIAQARLQALDGEIRKVERFLARAASELQQKESETVQALVDAFAMRAQDILVVRARAWSRTRYLRTAGVLVGAGLTLLLVGMGVGHGWMGNGAPADFLDQCIASLRRDEATGNTAGRMS